VLLQVEIRQNSILYFSFLILFIIDSFLPSSYTVPFNIVSIFYIEGMFSFWHDTTLIHLFTFNHFCCLKLLLVSMSLYVSVLCQVSMCVSECHMFIYLYH
jgi:hypothetical protein